MDCNDGLKEKFAQVYVSVYCMLNNVIILPLQDTGIYDEADQ